MECLDRVVIATDSAEVEEVCRGSGAEVLMTSEAHPSGSDRVWEVADRLGDEFTVVVNVQGDEPLVSGEAVRAAVSMVGRGFEVGTCAVPASALGELNDPSVVKVVRARDASALYFSRALIPHPGSSAGGLNVCHLRHLGVYAYRREALKRWVELGPSVLEQKERLEQLRALENGMTIGVALVNEAAPGVDTPEDMARMEALLEAKGYGPDGELVTVGGATTGEGE